MKIIYICVWLCSAAVLLLLGLFRPEWMGSKNAFLTSLVGTEILHIYGVFVAISLASAAQMHLALNYLEEKKNRIVFDGTRRELRSSCLWLLLIFVAAIISLIVKSLVSSSEIVVSLINCINIWLLILYVTVLWDMTRSIFSIRAQVGSKGQETSGANTEGR